MLLTTRTNRNHRPGLGIALLALAAIVALAPRCGVVGHAVAGGLVYLIGVAGHHILFAALCLAGIIHLTPPGTVGLLFRTWQRSRREKVRAPEVLRPAALSRSEELRLAMIAEGYDADEVERVLPQMVQISAGIESQIKRSARGASRRLPS